jgi:macrophage erythroblast attacher
MLLRGTLLKLGQQSKLECELRLQQYIELIRSGEPAKLVEATKHARKYLTAPPEIGIIAAGLMAFARDEDPAYYFSQERWAYLTHEFILSQHRILSVPLEPLLYITLTAGLSALKTPNCHNPSTPATWPANLMKSEPLGDTFKFTMRDQAYDTRMDESGTNADEALPAPAPTSVMDAPVCPICSVELNDMAKDVPFAHHSKSNFESESVVLPNGRIYGSNRLLSLNEKLGTPSGFVRDPMETTKQFQWNQVRKVFIL